MNIEITIPTETCVQYVPLSVVIVTVWSYVQVLATPQHNDKVACKHNEEHGSVSALICKIYNDAAIIQVMQREIIWTTVNNEMDSMCKKSWCTNFGAETQEKKK